jgi:lipopolysaccharide transport system permease protein
MPHDIDMQTGSVSETVEKPLLIIQPTRGWVFPDLSELWRYRDLLVILANRDIRLRYRQSAIGVAWVLIQVAFPAAIFALVFGRLAHLPSEGVPYLLYVYCGLLAWSPFQQILMRAGGSTVAEARLITKVYFPRLIIPLASAFAVLVDVLVSFVVLIIFLVIFRHPVGWSVLTLPLWVILLVLISTGIAFAISALNVFYRDFMYALPLLIQVWMFASPVVYPKSLVPQHWQLFFALNPIVGVIDGFRWSILGVGTLPWESTLLSIIIAFIVLFAGSMVFRRVEKAFADVI